MSNMITDSAPDKRRHPMTETKEMNQLQAKVVRLYDELTLFSGQCALLCDAFAAVPA